MIYQKIHHRQYLGSIGPSFYQNIYQKSVKINIWALLGAISLHTIIKSLLVLIPETDLIPLPGQLVNAFKDLEITQVAVMILGLNWLLKEIAMDKECVH